MKNFFPSTQAEIRKARTEEISHMMKHVGQKGCRKESKNRRSICLWKMLEQSMCTSRDIKIKLMEGLKSNLISVMWIKLAWLEDGPPALKVFGLHPHFSNIWMPSVGPSIKGTAYLTSHCHGSGKYLSKKVLRKVRKGIFCRLVLQI